MISKEGKEPIITVVNDGFGNGLRRKLPTER
jgi:hypothetical protein